MLTPHPVLFYDGLCAYCNLIVRIVTRLDRAGRIYFAPIESPLGHQMIEKYPALRSIDTAFVVDTDRNRNERVAWRSLCAVRLGEYMGWPEKLLFLPFSIIPRTVGDWIYDFVAKNRNKWFGRHEMCPIPPPEIRERFISL